MQRARGNARRVQVLHEGEHVQHAALSDAARLRDVGGVPPLQVAVVVDVGDDAVTDGVVLAIRQGAQLQAQVVLQAGHRLDAGEGVILVVVIERAAAAAVLVVHHLGDLVDAVAERESAVAAPVAIHRRAAARAQNVFLHLQRRVIRQFLLDQLGQFHGGKLQHAVRHDHARIDLLRHALAVLLLQLHGNPPINCYRQGFRGPSGSPPG